MKNKILLFLCLLACGASQDIKIVKEVKRKGITITELEMYFSPGDHGILPHRYSGPVIGYVVEGDYFLQVSGGPLQLLEARGTFEIKDRIIHLWGGNASNETSCKVLATIFGRPDEPIIEFVKDYPREDWQAALNNANNQI